MLLLIRCGGCRTTELQHVINPCVLFYGGMCRNADRSVLMGCESRLCQNIVFNIKEPRLREATGCMLVLPAILSYTLLMVPAREHLETSVLK